MATQDAVAQPTRTGLKELLTYTVSILVIMGAMQRAVSITVTPLREDLREDLRLLHAGMRSLRQNMNTGFAQAQQERAALRCGFSQGRHKNRRVILCLVPAQEWYIIRPLIAWKGRQRARLAGCTGAVKRVKLCAATC